MAGKRAFGAKLGTYAGSTLTPIGQITKITPFKIKVASADTTSHDSAVDSNSNPWTENVPTLISAGECGFEVNYDPANTSHVALESQVGVIQTFKMTMPPSTPAVVWTFSGHIADVGPEVPHDNKMVAPVSIKITGIPTVGTT